MERKSIVQKYLARKGQMTPEDSMLEGAEYDELGGGELLDALIDKKQWYSFEMSRGVRQLEELVSVLGYSDLYEFLGDNSGAIEGILNFIQKYADSIPEWEEGLRNAVQAQGDV